MEPVWARQIAEVVASTWVQALFLFTLILYCHLLSFVHIKSYS